MLKSSVSQKILINKFISRLGILLHAGIYKIKSTAWKGASKSAAIYLYSGGDPYGKTWKIYTMS